MSKATITRLFIGSAIALGAGAIVGVTAVWLAIANHVFVMADAEIVGVEASGLALSLLGLGLAAGFAIMGGLIAGLVSWIGALQNTWQLERKSWFVVLLLLGILNFGFVAMIAYIIAGPDGSTLSAPGRAQAPAGA